MKRTGICLIAGLLLAALPMVMNAEKVPFYYGHSRELHASVYHQEENSGIKEGDEIEVKLIDIDPKTGKFKLSRKVLMPRPEKK